MPAPVLAANVREAMLELARNGPAPLEPPPNGNARLRVAAILPSFRRGSGGHATIVYLLKELHAQGHEVSLWLEDCEGRHARESADLTRRSFAEFFAADELALHTDFAIWGGADVVLATGWQTVARAQLLRGVSARAYLVQDHEPDFYGASAEALWAQETYRQGLDCIAASEWLADLLRSRYGARAGHFDLAVDHEIYRPRAEERRSDLVVFYARRATPRRAVPLGLLALEELARRRPRVEIALFGEEPAATAPFAHTPLGVLDAEQLAVMYSRAAVGMVLSLTNPSLVGLQMMACGLPCVELASESMHASFRPGGPPEMAGPDPLALCEAIEHLLDDRAHHEASARAGIELTAGRTWQTAAQQLERRLRVALQRAPR
jgi:glycosyltransferase involved in cell wall biosynthesis